MNYLKISDMASEEKPVEKMIQNGPEVMSDAELLSIILRTGTRDMNVITLSQMILNNHPTYKGLAGLNYRRFEELVNISGVGKVKACQILALTEISKRISTTNAKKKMIFDSSDSVADYFMEQMRYLQKERVYALFMSADLNCFYKVLISEGVIDRSLIEPREIFKEALLRNAKSIILSHNHPSGNPQPSDMDIAITQRIARLGEEMSLKLLDHIIIGDGYYYSMLEKGIIK